VPSPLDPTPLRQPTDETEDCPLDSLPAESVHHLTDLLPGCDYAAWFETNTGYKPDESYFADYKILPWNDALYLGFGKARPAEFSGSLFARFQSNVLTALYQPSEQGFVDMTKDISLPLIHIPGPDPTGAAEPGGSQWDWGNTYVYTPTTGVMTKHRNLPNVIHTWGLESTAAGLYVATGAHEGDYQTWTGEVFFSDDLGENWELIADKTAGVGAYRTYDITQFNGKLYIVWNDVYGWPCGLARRQDKGVTWQRLSEFTGYTHCRSRLFIYDNQLLALRAERDGILALQPDGSVDNHLFPDFLAQDWSYNPFAIDAQNRLYIVSQNQRILRTSDLQNWETLVASDRDFITLSYWPDQDKIVAGDRGALGRLWLLDPTVTAITPPAAPDLDIALNGNDVLLQCTTQSGQNYRIYRNDQKPILAPALLYFHAASSACPWSDPDASAQVGGIYYRVRSVNSDGDISGPTRMVGKFSYALTPAN